MKLKLSCFSIVNGAQTTSSLGLFLKAAKNNRDEESIEKLRKVFVLARILTIPTEEMRESIAIYNNTQNPITSRDMVSNREEQKTLNTWLLKEGLPSIYCEIRRGSQIPSDFNKRYVHRKTTNEELAQLAYAFFLPCPFTAKDKKSALFNNDYTQDSYIINKIYHDIFSIEEGILFQKKKTEIDEALFVQQLYKECKKYMKKRLVDRIENARQQKDSETNPEKIKALDQRITLNSQHLDTSGICMYYFLALYAEFKEQYNYKNDALFDYDRYYSDSEFRNKMIKDASGLFLTQTVSVLVKTATDAAKTANMNNWVRSQGCEPKFYDALRNEMASNMDLEDQYHRFVDDYKTAVLH